MTTNSPQYFLPTIEYSVIDAYNRSAAAQGSPRYAGLSAHADYNGHRVDVEWNSYRGYYIAQYMWSGPRVLARGSFESCLAAARRMYDKGALGASVRVRLREGDSEAAEICAAQGLQEGEDTLPWRTWKHELANQCAPDYAHRGSKYLFDADLLDAANTRDEYLDSVRAKHGRLFA